MKQVIFLLGISLISHKLQAQRLSTRTLLNMAGQSCKILDSLKQKGYKEAYGGPCKEGGFIYLWQNKNAHEYLFIYADAGCSITGLTYYVPSKTQYARLVSEGKKLLPDEYCYPQGRVQYDDGRKYYQVSLGRKQKNIPLK